jgi:lipopolysaccharide transport system ATP-binding protein
MSDDIAIKVENLSKCYQIYDKPKDRLLQMLTRGHKKYFREFWALKDVSFEVKKGETVGIIGRNGSGKSTLLQMICGTLTPTTGSIQTNGRIAALLELGSGFNPEFTGRENVYMNASVLGLSNAEISARFDEIVAFADIGDFIEQPINTYSSGMMVRLAFAVIAHVDADILVIDEALAVGDAFFTQKCMRFLRKFMETGTVLFVSHDTGAVRSLCSYAFLLNKGEIAQQGNPKIVSEKYLEALLESQSGKNIDANPLLHAVEIEPEETIDQRHQLFNNSLFRNDIQVFDFNYASENFGTGVAYISEVKLLDNKDRRLAWVIGGQKVKLRIKVNIVSFVESPIIGFFVKDKLGQNLFGDNTYLSYLDRQFSIEEGEILQAEFVFQMPRLANGDYVVTAAFASGVQDSHVTHHWIHDALVFKSSDNIGVTGIIGLPISEIRLDKVPTIHL